MKVTCHLSASPSPSSHIANTLLTSQNTSSSTNLSPNSLELDPALLASLSPFLSPLLSTSSCLLIPQASPFSLNLVSTLLIRGSCEGPCHLLQEVQEVLVALGCQERVQTLLERQISSRTEVVNPESHVGFSEASVGDNYWTEGSKTTCDDKKGNAAEGKKVEHEEEKKWQEQNTSKDEQGTDWMEAECDKAEGRNIDVKQEQLVVGKSKFKAKKGAEVTLLSCKLCSYEVKFHGGRCNAAGHLRKHMESAHGVKQPKFSCDKCSYSSTQAGHLRRHKNAKHEGIRYQCSLCEKSFSIKDGLTRHVENIHKGTTIPCPQCEYETPRMAVLRDHIKIKHLKLKYECDICGHKLNSKKNLKIHKNAVHEGIWLHCPEAGCDYKAKDSSTFRHHKKVLHDGERLACPHCSLRFTKITSLKHHMKKKHSADMAETE